MFKRTWNSPHYLARAASHSTKGRRNGRVDVLPPASSEALYGIAQQIDDGEQLLARLRTERDLLADELHQLQRVEAFKARHVTSPKAEPRIAVLLKEMRDMESRMALTRKGVGELKALLGGAGAVSFNQVFVEVARAQLSADVFSALHETAMQITRRAKRKGTCL